MMIVLMAALLVSFAILTFVSHDQNIKILKNEMKEEAKYIVASIELLGEEYLEKMGAVDESTRLTVVASDGKVLYDSKKLEKNLENHLERPEIQQALKKGYGEDMRVSRTMGKETYYYARLLKDGTVLRVSKTVEGIAYTAGSIFPVFLVFGAMLILFAWFLANWQTEKLIAPINSLNVEKPLEQPVYEELNPLLEALDANNKKKNAIANMRKEFSANVSHELKTPLTSITGYAEIMKNGLVKPEDIPLFSERIYKEARRLITLVEDTIKLSRLDEGAVAIEKEPVDLYIMTREICSRLAPQAAEKRVHISLEGESVTFSGIRQIMDEMIYNICENAIKYNVENGKVDIWVGNTLEGPKIIVTDTGIGIPKEHQERIFERFYRVDKSHSKEYGGTGLGLSIVKHGAQLHGAKVSVESEPGKGTRMQIEWGQA